MEFLSFYKQLIPTSSISFNINEILAFFNITSYTSDKITAIIPMGARKAGSSTIYPSIFDGTYLRCNAIEGAEICVYISHLK